jgi:hypothetical protein
MLLGPPLVLRFTLVLAALAAAPLRASAQVPADAFHMTLIGHADMQSGGEGFAMKQTPDGRRLLYVAHESAPHCFTIFDVTNPAQPRTVRVVDTPSPDVRCNSLDVAGNVLAVAAETKQQGQPGGGFRLYRLDDPASPQLAGYFDASGPHSRGAHHVWLSSDKLAHITSGAADFTPNRASDDQSIASSTSPIRRTRRRSAGGGIRASAPATPSRRRTTSRSPTTPTKACGRTTSTSSRGMRTARTSATSMAAS